MMSLWDALRMNMMISYQELVRTFHKEHHCSCGGEAGSLGDDRLSTILLQPPYEWFIYALDVLF
ncbi:hypothetical protein C3F37_20530 [Salmonella enterica subsp. enterica serovar Senftenberg]|nr:hypothetical protein C3F37_20530 [Salmonella enterica subsp. enterica serovar Senftenberg]QBY70599.1 hypothetical protein EIP71_01745 [Salmonella enterica subsp. enterica serovar Senftenberg]QBY79861.1 hypothetical protein EIO66_01745 [Salmonella enterica subsp. enterica serovar Senftenberg]QCC10402.1 hypothetical protein EIP70_01745 [Salmonella enterica subsp. enterica serovar Senftenberg]